MLCLSRDVTLIGQDTCTEEHAHCLAKEVRARVGTVQVKPYIQHMARGLTPATVLPRDGIDPLPINADGVG